MQKYYHSIRFRIMQLCILFTLTLCLLIGYSFHAIFSREELRNSIEAAEFNLHLITNLTSQRCGEMEMLANRCVTDPNGIFYLSDSDPTPMQRIDTYTKLNDLYTSSSVAGYIQRLILTDGSRKIIQMGATQIFLTPLTEYNLQTLPYLDTSGRDLWQHLTQDPLTSSFPPSIVLIQPVYTRGQQVCGKLYVTVSSEILTNQLENYQLNPGDALHVKIGGICYAFEDHQLVPCSMTYTYRRDIPNIAHDVNTKVSWCKNENGIPYIAVSRPVGRTGMEVIHYQSQSGTRLPSKLLILSILAAFVVLVFMGAVLYFVLNRIIMKPVYRLQNRLDLVAAGDFSQDASIEWDNELGTIGRGINHLSESVQRMMAAQLEEEKKRQKLEYKILQEQISPHFIYNTLYSIKWMATIQKSEGIAEMTSSLARLMRYLSKSSEDLIPLGEELQLLGDYCTIQRYRYGSGIVFDILPVENPEHLACRIPRFTLQPLVENAIFHGIEPNGGIGRITIAICSGQNGELEISVSDDGIGMPTEQVSEMLRTGEGEQEGEKFLHTGILNVHRRIQYAFGPEYGTRLSGAVGKGVTITITIPGNPPGDRQTHSDPPQEGKQL